MPAGSAPEVTAYVAAPTPPVCVRETGVKATPAVPFAKDAGLRVMVAQLTTSETATPPVQPRLSVAVTVKGNVPTTVGVPARTPAEERASPAGSAPAVTAHV